MVSVMGNMTASTTLSNISLGIIDYDQSQLSMDFKDYLSDKLNYNIIENASYDMLSTELIEKNISAIIEIPEDFHHQFLAGSKKELVLTTLDDYENSAFLQAYLNSYLSSIRVLSVSAGGDSEVFERLLGKYKNENVQITQTAAQEVDIKLIMEKEGFINSIGFFLMFIFSISIVLSFLILDDRLSGVFNRIQITPVKPVQYIVGSGIFGMLVCMIQVGIYCGYLAATGKNIGVPIWIIAVLMSLFSLFTVCFSLTIALAVKSRNAVISIIIGFSTIGCILGGAYFPITMSPKSLQNLARILPQFWFMDTLRKLQADLTANILPNLTILILFTILTFLIAAVLFSQHSKNN
jgi:ABC-2 type transport system permease protein